MNLTPEQRSLVDAVLRPLDGDDSQRELLEESLVLATTLPVPPKGDPVEVACARMEVTAKSFALRRRLAQVALVGAIMVISWLTWLSPESRSSFRLLLMSVQYAESYVPSDMAEMLLGDHKDQEDEILRQIVARVPPEHRLVAMGDLTAKGPLPRWKAVWDAHPDDPAHFMAYAAEVRFVTKEWPADLVETGERLDPGNGWFRLLQAAARIEKAVEPPVRSRYGSAKSALPPAPVVKDPPLLKEILSELEQVASMPRLDDYQKRLNEERLRGWPAPGDYPEQVLSILYRFQHPEIRMSAPSELRSLGHLFSAAAHQAGASGEKGTLDRLAVLFRRVSAKLAENPALMLQRLVTSSVMVESGRSFSSAYSQLGDPPNVLKFDSLVDGLDRRNIMRSYVAPDALSEGRGSQAASMFYYGGFPGAVPVSGSELRGARLAEYAMAERLIFHGATLAFGVVLGVVLLLSLRHRESCGLLGARLAGLLNRLDRLVIGLTGIALPALVYVAVVHAPWSRSRDLTLTEWRFDSVMLVQVAALAVSMMLCTLQVIRWRLGRRGAVLALGWNGFDPGWWLVPMALSAIPVAEFLPGIFEKWSVDDDLMVAAMWSLVGLPFSWFIVLAGGHLLGAVERRVHRATVIGAFVPFMALALILTATAIPVIHQLESHWTRQIDFECVTPERVALESRVNVEHANWLQAEQLKYLRALD